METDQNSLIEAPKTSKKIFWIIATTVLVTFCIIGLLFALWQKRTSQENATVLPSLSSVEPSKFSIKGSEIYEMTNKGEVKLFINVHGVTDVRYGPDGKTIHFRGADSGLGQALCANPDRIESPDPASPNDPPQSAPWDYQRVANAYTINGCGEQGRAGGYLSKSHYFSYVEVRPSGDVGLVLEDISTQTEQRFAIDRKIWDELLANGLDVADNNLLHYELTGTLGNNGSMFYYPQADALLSNGKVVIAMARLLIGIDPQKGRLMGTVGLYNPTYPIVLNSFWFHSNENSPFMVVESGWEGGSSFDAILDLSKDALVVEKLTDYPQPNTSPFKTNFIEWNASGMMLHLYRQIDITDQVSKKDLALFQNPDTAYEILEAKNKEIQKQLQATGKWIEVACALPPGIGDSNCTALIQGTDYQITETDGLHKL